MDGPARQSRAPSGEAMTGPPLSRSSVTTTEHGLEWVLTICGVGLVGGWMLGLCVGGELASAVPWWVGAMGAAALLAAVFLWRLESAEPPWEPTPCRFDALATYNSEVARGVVHTAEYRAKMAALTAEFVEWQRAAASPGTIFICADDA
jgi:hypothetical protein